MSKTALPEAIRRSDTFILDVNDITIITDPANPFFDPRSELPLDSPEMQWLIDSIMEAGRNYSPISVRKNGKHPDGKNVIEVIDGRQRTKAIREINRRYAEIGREPLLIEAKYMTATEEKDFIGKMVTMNEARLETPPSMLAMQIDRYIESGGNYKEAERKFFKTEAKLRQLQAIARLCDDVKRAVAEGTASLSAAQQFVDMSVQQQRVTLKQFVESGEKVTAKSVAEKRAVIPCADGGIPAPKVKLPRLKSRKEIQARIAEIWCIGGDDSATIPGWNPSDYLTTAEKAIFISALKWVLGSSSQEE